MCYSAASWRDLPHWPQATVVLVVTSRGFNINTLSNATRIHCQRAEILQRYLIYATFPIFRWIRRNIDVLQGSWSMNVDAFLHIGPKCSMRYWAVDVWDAYYFFFLSVSALDLAQNSNVQDAFVIAVEQQARERLERLSALKRIKPIDMTKLSQQVSPVYLPQVMSPRKLRKHPALLIMIVQLPYCTEICIVVGYADVLTHV